MTTSEPKPKPQGLTGHPWRISLRVASLLAGVGAMGWLIGLVWPEPDQVAGGTPPTIENPASLAPYPTAPVTVLLVGIDSDRVGDPSNGAAPEGAANADALLLVRIDASRRLEILQIPAELAVQSPGADAPISLASLWQAGGVSLLRDAIVEIVGLEDSHPQRFAVMPRSALRQMVDGLGSVDVILSQSFDQEDFAQDYRVKLEAGRQSLNGSEAEQLVRYRVNAADNPNRRIRQQQLIRAVVDQFQAPDGISGLAGVLGGVSPLLDTNLSKSEMLSLAAAVVASPQPVKITQLPLADRAGDQSLRQLSPGQSLPLWPAY